MSSLYTNNLVRLSSKYKQFLAKKKKKSPAQSTFLAYNGKALQTHYNGGGGQLSSLPRHLQSRVLKHIHNDKYDKSFKNIFFVLYSSIRCC